MVDVVRAILQHLPMNDGITQDHCIQQLSESISAEAYLGHRQGADAEQQKDVHHKEDSRPGDA